MKKKIDRIGYWLRYQMKRKKIQVAKWGTPKKFNFFFSSSDRKKVHLLLFCIKSTSILENGTGFSLLPIEN